MKFHKILTGGKDCFLLVLFASQLTKCQLSSGRNLIELCWVLQWLTSLLLRSGRKHYITCNVCHPEDKAAELKEHWHVCNRISSFPDEARQYSPCMQCPEENRIVKISKSTHLYLITETTVLTFTRPKAWAQDFEHTDLGTLLGYVAPGMVNWARLWTNSTAHTIPTSAHLAESWHRRKMWATNSQSQQRHSSYHETSLHCPKLTSQDQGSPILECFQNRTLCFWEVFH